MSMEDSFVFWFVCLFDDKESFSTISDEKLDGTMKLGYKLLSMKR